MLVILIVSILASYVCASCDSHVVKPDSTCDELAYLCDITRERLEQLNPGLCPVTMVGREYCCNDGGLPRQCDSERSCPLGACCDANGRCGFSPQHCETGCQRDCSPRSYAYEKNEEPARVGYFDASSHRRQCVNSTITSISQFYTHVIYAHLYISSNDTVLVTVDDDNVLVQFAMSSTKYKKLVSIKDDDNIAYTSTFSGMLNGNVAAFVESVSQVVDAYGLDGIDLYWPHAGSEHRGSSASDMPKYVDLMVRLRRALGYDRIISVAMPASYKYLKNFDIAGIQGQVDYITYMTYDMHGEQGEYYTDTMPNLRSHFDVRDVRTGLRMLATARVPKSKVLMGVATHARTFVEADTECHNDGCKFADMLPPGGECTMSPGILSRAEVSRLSDVRRQWNDTEGWSSVINYGANYIAYIPSTDDVWGARSHAASLGLAGSVDWSIDLEADYAPTLDPSCRLDRIQNSVDVTYLPANCRAYGAAAMLYNFNAGYYKGLKKLVDDASHDSQIEYYVEHMAGGNTPNPKTIARKYMETYETLRNLLVSSELGSHDWVDVAIGSSMGVLSLKYVETSLGHLYSVIDNMVDMHKRQKTATILSIVSIVLPIVTIGAGAAISMVAALASTGLTITSTVILPPDSIGDILLTALGFAFDIGALAASGKALTSGYRLRKMAGAAEKLMASEAKGILPEVIHEAKKVKYTALGVCK